MMACLRKTIITNPATLRDTVMSLPPSRTIQNNATLVLTPSTSHTFAGLVAGSGSLTIGGGETLSLAGVNDEEGSHVQATYEVSKFQRGERSP